MSPKHTSASPEGRDVEQQRRVPEFVFPGTQRGNIGRKPNEFVPYAIPIGKLVSPRMGILVDSGRRDTRDRVRRAVKPPEKPHRVTEQDIVLTANDLMKMPITLTDDMFARLFPKGSLPQQTTVGNCWAVAALTVTRNYPFFKAIIQRSMRQLTHGGKCTGWAVRIPLGNAHGKEVHIQKSELDPGTMDAPLGFHVLQAVIGKSEAKRAENAGVPLHTRSGELNLSKLMNRGRSERALTYLFGNAARESSIDGGGASLMSASDDVKRNALRYLQNFSPQFDLATFGTRPAPAPGQKRFTLEGVRATFLYRHAYAIRGVDAVRQTVTVQDPRSEETCTLTWRQAFKIFMRIDRIELFGSHRPERKSKRLA